MFASHVVSKKKRYGIFFVHILFKPIMHQYVTPGSALDYCKSTPSTSVLFRQLSRAGPGGPLAIDRLTLQIFQVLPIPGGSCPHDHVISEA